MSDQSKLAKTLDRVASLTRVGLIRDKDVTRDERNGKTWAMEEGLAARVGELEDAVARLEERLSVPG